jgi:hypothetical protein
MYSQQQMAEVCKVYHAEMVLGHMNSLGVQHDLAINPFNMNHALPKVGDGGHAPGKRAWHLSFAGFLEKRLLHAGMLCICPYALASA